MAFLQVNKEIQRRRQYDIQALNQAYNAVRNNNTSVYKAARQYGVPESTLRDHTLGHIVHGSNPGPNRIFSEIEENKLVEHFAYMAKIGYGYSQKEVLEVATAFAISTGKKKSCDPSFGRNWFHGFMKRWPHIQYCKPRKLELKRAECLSKKTVDSYFDELGAIMADNHLLDKPQNVYNIDETGFSTEHSPQKIVSDRGIKPQSITSPRSQNVTLIGSGNAIGTMIPPYFVFPGKRWNPEFIANTPIGTDGVCSETGWSNTDVFKSFLSHHFLKFAQRDGDSPLLLSYDGHRSHISLHLTEWAESVNVILFVLPPHTSHVLQPLDVGCFGPLKRAYNQNCQAFLRQNPGRRITKFDVGQLAGDAYVKSMTVSNLKSSFRKTGIFPFLNSVTPDQLAPSVIWSTIGNEDKDHDENDTPLSTAVNTALDQDITNCYLESITVRSIVPKETKRRQSSTPIVGFLSKKTNIEALQSMKSSSAKRQLDFQKKSVTSTKSRQKSKKCRTEPCVSRSSVEPQPGPSRINIGDGIPVDSVSESDSDIEDTETVCCVCDRFSPQALQEQIGIVFVKWAKCDRCDHWTHLTFCSEVRVVRRGVEFICPHCE